MIDDLYSARIRTLAPNMPQAGRLTAPVGPGLMVPIRVVSKPIVDVVIDDQGRVTDFAQEVKACALGQAGAGVVGEAAIGATEPEIEAARDAMLAMLKSGGEGPTGRFEGLRILKQVADYPARHASSMVAIEALLEAVRQALKHHTDTRTNIAGAA
ncbi:iron-sulfur cluster assembly scaffold protein [uncultured Brevundimonas sp.]|uniref:iron-sulfur cluster assembly scaffold protein n=1 Tax=uncultured Brevundimonas sp. TaxID=213418 RepID=UPI0026057321|nr:iron-sulfur cluster assembly scaffold protein [uncultured Brevundimonas sp.]